jgi:hypothetical protein
VVADDLEFVCGQKALIAQAGKLRFKRRQGIAQPTQGRVAVGLGQSFAAEAGGLARVEAGGDWRFVTGRATQCRPIAMDDKKEQWRGATTLACLPNRPNIRQAGFGWRIRNEDFKRRCALPEGEAAYLKGAIWDAGDGAEVKIQWECHDPRES